MLKSAISGLALLLLVGCGPKAKTPAPKKLQQPMATSVPTEASPERALVPPEIVQLEAVSVDDHLKSITMKNAAGEYHLSCSRKAAGCETPSPGNNYLLFDKHTYWKLPKATSYIDLAFIQKLDRYL